MIAGALQLLLGLLQFGFLSIYLSDPINGAFACGAALHIVSSQLGNILGARIPTISGNGKFFLHFIEAFKEIVASRVNIPTILIFIIAFLVLLAVKIINERCIKHIRMPIPIDIIVLILSLLLSKFLFWQTTLKISTVGEIRKGFESPKAPLQEHFTTGSGIIVNGIVMGIISYSISISLAKTFALRNGYEIDPNQEMIAYGAVNFGMCWFGTFVSASSIACTSLHESLKGKTQVYSLYAISITLIGILVFAPEFSPVPKCVLSAIIIVNLKNMILQVEQLPRLWRTNRYDFAIFLVTLAGILGLDLPIGLLIGVVFSLATAEQIPGLKIFKFEGSLYFASAENYRNRLYRQVAMNPKRILAKAKTRAKREGRGRGEVDLRTDMLQAEGVRRILEVVAEEGSHSVAEARIVAQVALPVEEKRAHFESVAYHSENEETASTVNVFCIILDMSACAFTDAVGIRLLSQIVDDFSKIGVEIYLSGCTWLVRSQLRKANFYAKRSEEGLFVTVHDAVIHALSLFYHELLQDEAKLLEDEDKHRHGSHPQEGSAAASTQEGTATEGAAASLHKAKQSAAELARDRRRLIRYETWRRNSNAELQSGQGQSAPPWTMQQGRKRIVDPRCPVPLHHQTAAMVSGRPLPTEAAAARSTMRASATTPKRRQAAKIASRPAFTEVQLEETFQNKMEPEEQKAHVQNLMDERKAGKEIKDKRAIALGIAAKVFPCLKVLLNYDIREYGPYDLLSGISVGLFIIPQAIAYSLLANMRPQAGFYSAFFAMTIYFIFGTSNHVNM
uniref:STAS domain-containing protein n=1 Tax=Macrostomum lignano TaxID=282301 RepID=A0A1I8IR72_9PLAT